MSLLGRLRAGATAERAASELGTDPELVRAALDHAERVGLVLRVRGCGEPGTTCAPEQAGASCRGCPFGR